jgi:hypothetical protein
METISQHGLVQGTENLADADIEVLQRLLHLEVGGIPLPNVYVDEVSNATLYNFTCSCKCRTCSSYNDIFGSKVNETWVMAAMMYLGDRVNLEHNLQRGRQLAGIVLNS